jgi:formylglycine-generating enzyme required for sulfatase activity
MKTTHFMVVVLLLKQPAQAVTIETVLVGHPGNAAHANGLGRVDYEYRIGKFEVTNDQYVEFLNAKGAGTDPLGLFEPYYMGSLTFRGGIDRLGPFGFYSYASKPNMGNKPVNHTTWYDAIRFINWLHNGQGDGDTETGAYTLEGGTVKPSNGPSIVRNPDAKWFMPNENEWLKAGYYQPTDQGGDVDSYWNFPTRSNSAPTAASANEVGDISNPGPNVANHNFGATWNGILANVTNVGSAGPLSASYFGTLDQGGNVSEWNETLYGPGVSRGHCGGFYVSPSIGLGFNSNGPVGAEYEGGGFRVATYEVAAPLAGDFDVDGDVDGNDFLKWQRGESPNHGDAADLAEWRAHFGEGSFATAISAAVPEPATFVPLMSAAVLIGLQRSHCAKRNSEAGPCRR